MINECVISLLYVAGLGRPAGEVGLNHWINYSVADVAHGIYYSDEYQASGRDISDWYIDGLGREADEEGLIFWSSLPGPVALVGVATSIEAGCPPIVAPPAQPTTEQLVIDEIYAAAAHYGISGDRMLRIAKCESGLDPYAKNSRSSATGIFQYLTGTWNWISDAGAPYPYADRTEYKANIHNAAWLMSRDDLGSWGHWVCS